MQFKNTPVSYGVITKTFHWIIGPAIIGMLAMGLWMDGLETGLQKLQMYNLHKSIGVTILTLSVLRILWHVYSTRPPLLPSLAWWEKLGAHAVHIFLYVGMIGMPMSGWLLSSAAGRPVQFFGLFTLPDLIAPSETLRDLLSETHEILAYALMLGITAHVLAALKHHFISKDGTLRRMLPFSVVALMIASATVAYAQAPKWTVIAGESKITFSGKQMGKDFSGSFKKFDADIAFDAANLAQSKVTATIDIGNLESTDSEVGSAAKGADWLNATAFPTARFETTSFAKTGDDTFIANGNLTIKDVTLPVQLPFTLKTSKAGSGKEKAVMNGALILDRSKFKLGQGEWADTSVIANDIKIDVVVTAEK